MKNRGEWLIYFAQLRASLKDFLRKYWVRFLSNPAFSLEVDKILTQHLRKWGYISMEGLPQNTLCTFVHGGWIKTTQIILGAGVYLAGSPSAWI